MSSTTDRRRERGQVLAIFAFGLVGIIAIAALVFDVGSSIVMRRQEQDASDAAALAAARWLTQPACVAAPSAANCPEAVDAAYKVAALHGYASSVVSVHVPPTSTSQFAGLPGHVQVEITSSRGSYFAGVLGIRSFKISAQAVAANINNYAFPYSFMAVSPTCPKTGHLSGNGTFDIGSSVYVAADCDGSPGALVFDGNRTIAHISGSCASQGTVAFGPSSTVTCNSVQSDAPPVADPLANLQPPSIGGSTVPNPAARPLVITGTVATGSPPKFDQCPGVGPSSGSAANPATCIIQPTGGPATVRMYPGVYYGGIQLTQQNASRHLTVYLEPGIYYMAGGGFQISSDVDVYTVDPGGTTYGAAGTSGVMIFNGDDPMYASACAAGTAGGAKCIGNFDDTNDTVGIVKLRGYSGRVYSGILLYQDRNASSQPAVKLTGNSQMTIAGSFYLPGAQFSYQGNGGSAVFNSSIICGSFDIGGNGNLSVTWSPDDALKVSGLGLVQ